jgi:hypothetical protein
LDLIAELERVVDALEMAGVDYALCGGLALAIHGHPRATKDIDILLRSETLEAGLAAVHGAGFDIPARKMTFGLKTGRAREVQRVSKLDSETGQLLVLDFLLVGPELEDAWAGRIAVRSGDRTLTVVSRDGLATMKRIAGRKQDLADLAKLEGSDDDDEER